MTKKIRVLFVCHGNICRSPMAEFVMKHILEEQKISHIEVASAALHTDEIGSDTHWGTKQKLREEGVAFTHRAAWLLTKEKAKDYDLIIGMDRYNMADLERVLGKEDFSSKARMMLSFAGRDGEEVADPWYTHDFNATYRDILEGCQALAEHLRSGEAEQ